MGSVNRRYFRAFGGGMRETKLFITSMYFKGHSLVGAHGQVDKALDPRSTGLGSITSAGHV